MSSLPPIFIETASTVYQALGWLAREGKIDLRQAVETAFKRFKKG
jgi:hypothetical protein